MHNLNELGPKVVPDIQVDLVAPVTLENHAFLHSDRFAGIGYLDNKHLGIALGVALLVFVLALRCLWNFSKRAEQRRMQQVQLQAAAEARRARAWLGQNKRRRLNHRF
ncbi:hypothetical protein PFICI_12946 [Pestalotiopsis fici W106-1]|uniref:Uncharacterized protein n=1 Tax=Pestalotiopsis fici (strain W106-1 / CGMCC3.15140) TaxID=1229662 RepID=W3WS60_PESFW|nr:uncharacterized protein PFICI_12946 [Pestalotiopsis fici W106-1]ETS76002.1 hypothetical protein PFICI_12946 [Pestalotiopsis fici W106-1]